MQHLPKQEQKLVGVKGQPDVQQQDHEADRDLDTATGPSWAKTRKLGPNDAPATLRAPVASSTSALLEEIEQLNKSLQAAAALSASPTREATALFPQHVQQPEPKDLRIQEPGDMWLKTCASSFSEHGKLSSASLAGAPAAQERCMGASGRGHQIAGENTVKVELELPPNAAAHMVDGEQMVVHKEWGGSKPKIILADPCEPKMFIPVSGTKSGTVEQQSKQLNTARHKAAKRKQTAVMLSDEEMIASLAGCASVPPTPASTATATETSSVCDKDLVAALAADAIHASQSGVMARDLASVMSDEEIAAALAGCAQQTQAPSAQDIEAWMNAPTCNYDDVPHDDGGLGLALFDSSE